MRSRFLLWGLAILAGVLLVVAGTRIFAQPYTFRGSLIDPPLPAVDFVLSDQDGQPFRLSDLRGKVVVMAFGYTACPDVCPATLSDFKRIRALLGDRADQVQFVFVTVDPERDTPDRLRGYMAAFDPAFKGLSGDLAALEHVWQSYGVYHKKQFVGSASGYLVDHTSRIYVVDAQSQLRLTFPFGTGTESMVQDIRHLAEERL